MKDFLLGILFLVALIGGIIFGGYFLVTANDILFVRITSLFLVVFCSIMLAVHLTAAVIYVNLINKDDDDDE